MFACALTCMPGASAENSLEVTTTRLVIDSNASTLQLMPPSLFLPQPPSGPVLPFGGIVDVRVSDFFIDTLGNGAPRSPVTISSISIEFVSLDLPAGATGFDPGRLDTFEFESPDIPGTRANPCRSTWAMGGSCTYTELIFGAPDSMVGTFDGQTLSVTGAPAHGLTNEYYAFSLTATPVPLPASAGLLCAAAGALLGLRQRRLLP